MVLRLSQSSMGLIDGKAGSWLSDHEVDGRIDMDSQNSSGSFFQKNDINWKGPILKG